MKSWLLFCLIFPISSILLAQEGSVPDLGLITQNWQSRISEIDKPDIKTLDRHVSYQELMIARERIVKNLDKALEDYQEDLLNDKFEKNLIFENTNASLWYAQVTTSDFQNFLKRMVLSRPISKAVIENLKKQYFRWIKNPSVKNLEKYSNLLLNTGRSYEILTRMQITIHEIDGATIKYRPIINDDTETLTNLDDVKTVPVGNYYVWLEKNGEVLSDNINAHPCITGTKRIELKGW